MVGRRPPEGPASRRTAARATGPAAILAALLLAAAILPLAPAAAQDDESLGVTPPSHLIEEAIDGESYRRQVSIQNEFDSPTVVTLNTSGEVGAWTTTDPTSGFEVPPRTHEAVDLTIHVPEDAVNGTYQGKLHVTAEAKDSPDGSGASIRYSVAVLLTVQVGGDPVHDLRFSGGGASDVEEGSPPDVSTTVTNRGNVRDTAEACAVVHPFDGGEQLAQARAETRVLPGEQTTLDFDFEEALPQGQYRAVIVPGCEDAGEPVDLDDEGTFKVVPVGTLGKDGMLRYLEHAPEAKTGQPLEVQAVFDNVGETDIARATATVEVYRDGELVDVLTVEPRVVPYGEEVRLTGYFTPEEPGRYTLHGVVTYDGFETEPRESFLTVQGEGIGDSGWFSQPLVLLVGGLLLAGLVTWLVWRKRGGDEAETGSGSSAVDAEALETADVEALDR